MVKRGLLLIYFVILVFSIAQADAALQCTPEPDGFGGYVCIRSGSCDQQCYSPNNGCLATGPPDYSCTPYLCEFDSDLSCSLGYCLQDTYHEDLLQDFPVFLSSTRGTGS